MNVNSRNTPFDVCYVCVCVRCLLFVKLLIWNVGFYGCERVKRAIYVLTISTPPQHITRAFQRYSHLI